MDSPLAPVIALSALALVAAGLVCAGLYALFGKPSSSEAKERKRKVVHGFQLGGGVLLGIVLMGALLGGSQIAFGIIESPRFSRVAASLIVLAALGLILSMIRMWARHFAGWIGCSVLNGLLMLESGHLVNNPGIPVPRWWSASMIVLAVVTVLVSIRFAQGHELKWPDKAALMTWVIAFTLAVDVASVNAFYQQGAGVLAMLFGCMALVAAWWHDRAAPHRRSRAGQLRGSAQHVR